MMNILILLCFGIVNGVLSHNCSESSTDHVTIIYEVINQLHAPQFDYTVKVTLPGGEPMIRFMEKAADSDTQRRFDFTASYYSGLGYLVTTINHVTSQYDTDRTYWEFLVAPNYGPSSGVSSFIPKADQHIIFNFTKSS